MLELLLGLLTSLPALVASGGLSGIALAAPLFGYVKGIGAVLARILGVLALVMCGFIGGYRVADERAELDKLKADKVVLERDLKAQREVAAAASAERSKLTEQRAELQKRVNDYERSLVPDVSAKPASDNKPKPNAASCALNAADVRFYRSLFNRPRKPPR